MHSRNSLLRALLGKGFSIPCCYLALNNGSAEQEFCNLVNAEERCEDRHAASCAVCGDGGDLLCCDACPTAVHPACIGMESIPEVS